MAIYSASLNETFCMNDNTANPGVDFLCRSVGGSGVKEIFIIWTIEVDRISASVSVSATNVDKWALSVDIRFLPKAVVPHSINQSINQ